MNRLDELAAIRAFLKSGRKKRMPPGRAFGSYTTSSKKTWAGKLRRAKPSRRPAPSA